MLVVPVLPRVVVIVPVGAHAGRGNLRGYVAARAVAAAVFLVHHLYVLRASVVLIDGYRNVAQVVGSQEGYYLGRLYSDVFVLWTLPLAALFVDGEGAGCVLVGWALCKHDILAGVQTENLGTSLHLEARLTVISHQFPFCNRRGGEHKCPIVDDVQVVHFALQVADFRRKDPDRTTVGIVGIFVTEGVLVADYTLVLLHVAYIVHV